MTKFTPARLRPLLPWLLTAVLFAAGAAALHHLLAGVRLTEIMAMVKGTPAGKIALALALTMAGYATLIGYDWSALRYIGKRLPFPVIATGSFLGYGIGNTVGAGPVTGGAVRYRIYSAMGLTAGDIAAISIYSSVAFGLGATITGLLALVWHPHALGALLSWPPEVIRWGALALSLAALGTVGTLSLRRVELTVRGVTIAAPEPRLLAGQFLFTAAETLISAAVLYLLLPSDGVGFAPFLAIFAAAVMAGVVSHVPGGVGVFETVILATIPAGVQPGEAAAGLLLYRLIYYIFPFTLALILMAASEAQVVRDRLSSVMTPVVRATGALMPLAMAAMVFVSGAMMMTAAILPPTDAWAEKLERLLPLGFVESGALFSSIIGAALLVIAHGLLRRVEGAWWLGMTALLAGVAASLANGLDYDRAALLFGAALVLFSARREFYRPTRLTRNVLGLRWSLMMICLAGALIGVLHFAHRATAFESDLWWQFASDKAAPRALRASLSGTAMIALLLLVFALRPGRSLAAMPGPAELDQAARIVAAQPRPDAMLALTGDKALLFSDSGDSFLMYRTQGRSMVALHGPVGRPEEARDLAWSFHDAALAANCRPVFYAVSASSLWIDMGLVLHKLGEEAIVDLAGFSLDGPSRKRLRTTYNRAQRDGLSFEVLTPPHAPALLAELREISEAWLASKAGAEKGFSVGAFDPDYLDRTPLALIRHDGRITAFANLWVTEAKSRAALDLMRHRADAPSGMMEFLFTSLLLHFKAEGFAEFSLGNAPLSGLEARRGARLSTHLGAFVYRHGGQFYNFEGLRGFKQKFDPRWDPVYVAVPPRSNLALVAADLVTLIGSARKAEPKPALA